MTYVVHPLELPVNQVAAQSFQNNFPELVTADATMSAERTAAANAALAARGTTNSTASAALSTPDTRVSGGAGATATVTTTAPTSGAHGSATSITVTGTNLTKAKKVTIGHDCANVVVVSATSITCTTPKNAPAGATPVLVTFSDMSVLSSSTNFTYT